ncbi:MAG: response regulator [Muribaculum sp.]|nr:response regulator [Muribaculum sp.]
MVFEDSRGRVFVGTHRGLQLYNPQTDVFTPLARTEDGSIYNASIAFMFESEPDSIWTVRNARSKILKADYDGIVLRRMSDEGSPLYDTDGGLTDAAGFIWFYNRNGLFRLNKRGEIVSRHTEINDPVNLKAIQSHDGTIYVAAFTKGLYRYDIVADKFILVPDPTGQSLLVRSLYSNDSDPCIYLATDGHGLKRYDPDTGEFSTVPFGDGVLDESNQKVHSMLTDRGGNIWIAIFQKGIVMVPAMQESFKYIGHKSFSDNLIGEKCVVSLARNAGNGSLWVGLDNGGLYEVNLNAGTSRSYPGTVPDVVSGLYVDSRDNLWIGSFSEGCGIFDTNKKTYRKVPLYDSNGNEVKCVYDFTEDEHGNIWIASLGGGLFSYDHISGVVTPGDTYTGDKWFTSIHYSRNSDALYLGSYDGMIKVDSIYPNGTSKKIFAGNIIHAVKGTSDGNIWFASSAGLGCYNPETDSVKVYTIEYGLPVNTVYGIEEDNQGVLWVSTSRGLVKFNPKLNSITNFYVDDGLQGNEFYKKASYKDASGMLYFGGTDGITYFNPSEVVKPGHKWTVRLTDIYLHGQPVKGGMTSGGHQILDGPVYNAEQIHLGYSDNSFSIEFATEEFGNSESMVYQYSLDDDKWVTLAHGQNMVNFSDLNPGKHKLMVRTEDSGVISDARTVVLNIGRPWYATWWAYLIYALLLSAIIFYVYYEILRQQRRKRQDLEHRQAEQINEAKFQFFINISHEIRTPMSLVMSPLQKLIDTDTDASRRKNYLLIQRNAKRVLRLINELMDIRKIDKNRLKLSFAETMITPFLADLYDTFSNAAQAKNIDFEFVHDGCDDLKVWVDHANFDKIVLNLLSNAVKYTPEGGKVVMSLTTGFDHSMSAPLDHYAEIAVTDTGIGVPDDEKSHIFDRFYQVAGNTAGGTGVGLHLTQSLVKLHHGVIMVVDNPEGSGTRFVVRIPLGSSHLKNESVLAESSVTHSEDEIRQLVNSGLTPVSDECADSDDSVVALRRPTNRETVLVVEDDADIRNYLVNELGQAYRVLTCENGKEAFSQIQRKAPDIVISDVMMPEMDGLELTSKIKGNINLNHIPIVLLTAKTRDEDNIKGLEAGADAYIPKPFNIDMLSSTVAALLKKHRQLKATFSGRQVQDDKVSDIQIESYDEKLMAKVMKVIDKNISNPDITVEMLASEVGLSRVHLHRKLKELTNQAPREFIRNTRLRMAAKMLVENRLSVADVAMALGFKNANNFATAFKTLYGVSPTEYVGQNQTQA